MFDEIILSIKAAFEGTVERIRQVFTSKHDNRESFHERFWWLPLVFAVPALIIAIIALSGR